jgi:hypothetical protein
MSIEAIFSVSGRRGEFISCSFFDDDDHAFASSSLAPALELPTIIAMYYITQNE